MTKAEIIEIVQGIIGNILQVNVDLAKGDVNLFDLGLDSMSIVDFLVAVEEEFSLEIEESDLKEDVFASANKIVDLIEHNLTEGA